MSDIAIANSRRQTPKPENAGRTPKAAKRAPGWLQREIRRFSAISKSQFKESLSLRHLPHYLLTRNCTHIANAAVRGKIEQACLDLGLEPPIICTPEELMEI